MHFPAKSHVYYTFCGSLINNLVFNITNLKRDARSVIFFMIIRQYKHMRTHVYQRYDLKRRKWTHLSLSASANSIIPFTFSILSRHHCRRPTRDSTFRYNTSVSPVLQNTTVTGSSRKRRRITLRYRWKRTLRCRSPFCPTISKHKSQLFFDIENMTMKI